MPVLFTRPASAVARATASLLLDDGAQVRLFGPDAPADLRARGAFVATGTRDDHGLLEAALEQVHTLVHVGPGLAATSAAEVVREAALTFGAAERAGIERLVVLSLPGAGPAAGDDLRTALGEVEQLAEAAPIPSVVVRAGLVDTVATRDLLAAAGRAVDEDVLVAPVRLDDLALGLLAVDEARSRATSGHVVLHAVGPEELRLGTYVDRVVRDATGRVDLVGRVYRPGASTGLAAAALGGSWTVGPTDGADLWRFAGHTPRPVSATAS